LNFSDSAQYNINLQYANIQQLTVRQFWSTA